MEYNLNTYQFAGLSAWMDGGSITLSFRNETHEELTIDLQQFVNTEYYAEISKIPGRVYLNNKIIDKRSLPEKLVLEFLKNNVLNQLIGLENEILLKQIHWIESKDYVNLVPTRLKLSKSRKKELGI
ncbi:hypothetical protein [Spongiimicrobium salis]|uniref:hypothetical protein n=1 Tax=Spongiimicrobium salis TaxID=1667022 RepID=UPI00374D4FAD